MKPTRSVALLSLLVFVAGCTTSSKVQEMIDASHQGSLTKSSEHESSINILKKSSMTALEQNESQAATLVSLQKQLDAALAQLKVMHGNAEAAKVMSAANTVKVAELNDSMLENKDAISETAEKMETVDSLYEDVIIAHYQNLVDSAKAAIAALQVDDVASTNGVSVGLADPIEIVAPDTSAPTNTAVDE